MRPHSFSLPKSFPLLISIIVSIYLQFLFHQNPRKDHSTMADSKGPSKLPVTVQKPTPYTFDLGLLIANDPNPLLTPTPSTLEADLAATARDGAQALLNQLLGTCPIASTPNGVLLSLPAIETRLPREKVRKKPPLQKAISKTKNLTNPPLSAPPRPSRPNQMGALRRQKGNQSQDIRAETESPIQRSHRRVGAEMGV